MPSMIFSWRDITSDCHFRAHQIKYSLRTVISIFTRHVNILYLTPKKTIPIHNKISGFQCIGIHELFTKNFLIFTNSRTIIYLSTNHEERSNFFISRIHRRKKSILAFTNDAGARPQTNNKYTEHNIVPRSSSYNPVNRDLVLVLTKLV